MLTALSGMTYMEHLQDNIRTYSPLEPCSEEEFALLEETARMMLEYPTIPCNDCQYCMPCPYGIDIPAILLHYNRCINEGNIPHSRQDGNYRKARRAFPISRKNCTASTTSSNDSNRARYNLPTSDKVRRVCKSFSPWYESCRSIN